MSSGSVDPRWSVVVCAYTFERLELTSACIRAVLAQPEQPEVIVVTDHNDELGEALRIRFPGLTVDLECSAAWSWWRAQHRGRCRFRRPGGVRRR